MRAAVVILAFLVAVGKSAAQDAPSAGVVSSDLSPQDQPASPHSSSLIFRPLVAATFEPRVGFQYQLGPRKLRLDIGYSTDIWSTQRAVENASSQANALALGVDAFTYTRLRSEANLKFPVETVDYMFGINGTYALAFSATRSLAFRVRLSHISAHLADGYADSSGRFLQRPFVYSREFLDAIVAHTWANVRIYGGGTVLLQVKELPRSVGRIIPQLGVEWYGSIGVPVFAGYDVRVVQIDRVVQPVHSVQAGVYLLAQRTASVALCGYYYAGYSMHGMFYDQRDEYLALGMQVLF